MTASQKGQVGNIGALGNGDDLVTRSEEGGMPGRGFLDQPLPTSIVATADEERQVKGRTNLNRSIKRDASR